MLSYSYPYTPQFTFPGNKETNALNTSTCSDSAVTRRRRKNVSNKLTSSSSESTAGSENRLNRLSLAGTSVYAGHLSSLVLGKLKSLWTVNSNSADGGLNQFTGRIHFIIFLHFLCSYVITLHCFFFFLCLFHYLFPIFSPHFA